VSSRVRGSIGASSLPRDRAASWWSPSPSKNQCLPLVSAAGESSCAIPSLSSTSRAFHPSP
jgi:hypothetical protein